jgi:branched-chain amino acid transport system substrate-binding protein
MAKSNRLIAWAVLTLLLVALAGWAGGKQEGVAGAKTIKVGYTAPFTGSAAEFGVNGWRGVQLALEDINRQGIKVGSETYRIEIARYDSRCEPTEAVSNARKLILEDKVVALLGDHCSSCCLGVAPLCEEYKIPGVTVECMADAITSPGYSYYFRMYIPSGLVSAWASPVFVKLLNPKTVGFLAINDDYGRATSEGFSTELGKLGVKTVLKEYYERGTTDYMSYLSKFKTISPDILIYTGVTAEGSIILQQGREIGAFEKTKFLGSVEMSEEEIISLVGAEVMEGVYAWAVWESVPADFEKRVKDKFNAPMHYGITYGYDSLMVVAKAIEAAQSIEPSKIRDAIAKLDFPGVSGRVKFESFAGPNGKQYSNQCRIAPYLVRWVGGKRTVVK